MTTQVEITMPERQIPKRGRVVAQAAWVALCTISGILAQALHNYGAHGG